MKSSLLAILFTFVSAAVAQTFYGLNYGINENACPPLEKYIEDFKQIKKYTNRVRTFALSVCNQGALALQAANQLGMNIYLGMWIDRPDTFTNEMNALLSIVNNNQLSLEKVDGLIVGSEVLYRKDTDENSLANYLADVRKLLQGKNIPITTADVYYEFPPVVVEQLDFLMMNAFPYWEGVTAAQGATTLLNHYQSVVATKANGKPVKISETGWPSGGSNFGASVASPQDQALYLSNVLCHTRQNNIELIWFSAIDEPYKSDVEQHWGIMYQNYTLKPDLQKSISNPTC